MIDDIEVNKFEKLRDQFTTPTRNVRRNLLVSSSLTLMLLLVDAKISSLFGIKFSEKVPIFVPIGALFIVVMYEFLTFITYGKIDFDSWNLKTYEKTHEFTENKLKSLVGNLNKFSKNIGRTDLNEIVSLKEFYVPAIPFHIKPIQPTMMSSDGIDQIEELVKNRENELNRIVSEETTNFKSQLMNKLLEGNTLIENDINKMKEIQLLIQKEFDTYEYDLRFYQSGITTFNIIQKIRIYIIDWGIPLILGIISLSLSFESASMLVAHLVEKIIA